jgi:hypothetical protein
LPDKITSDYSIAVPLVDTTVLLSDFASFKQYELLLGQDILAEDTIHMGAQGYPFHINYSDSLDIKSAELRIIINPIDLPSSTKVIINIFYTGDQSNNLLYKEIPLGVPYLYTIEKNAIDDFRKYARGIFLDSYLVFNETISGAQIMKYKVNIKFAIKTDLTITL